MPHGDDEVRPRQCGRCRQLFEGDPTLHPAARPDWWLCPPCRTVLLGARQPPAPAASERPPLAPATPDAGRPLEPAQLVWQRARELADPVGHDGRVPLALDLLRAAHHDPATMAHALTLGRTHLRRHAGEPVAIGGVRILERAIAFLGVKPPVGDVAARPRRP